MKVLESLLANAHRLTAPERWAKALPRLTEERESLVELIQSTNSSVYGMTRELGHRQRHALNVSQSTTFDEDVFFSHLINVGGPYFSPYQARRITYAKLYCWSSGMSGVSPSLFKRITDLAVDATFKPRIPKGSSYSCGDVVPAAHWAYHALNGDEEYRSHQLQPAEIMAMINGNFVQAGYASSLVEQISECWIHYLVNTKCVIAAADANPSNLVSFRASRTPLSLKALSWVSSDQVAAQKNHQDPVSLRAVPQTIECWVEAIVDYFGEIDRMLSAPSGNPLFDFNNLRPLSQASFLAPNLSLRASSLSDSILFVLWSVVSRTEHLLSGEVSGVPQDASSTESKLGLIQYPKVMKAILERTRCTAGTRPFSSGGSASYGQEDLWSNGLVQLQQLETTLAGARQILSCESYVLRYIGKACGARLDRHTTYLRLFETDSSPETIERHLTGRLLRTFAGQYPNLFPVNMKYLN